MSQIRKFTLIQLVSFGCVFAVTKTQFAIAFPVMIAILVPLRRFVHAGKVILNYSSKYSLLIYFF